MFLRARPLAAAGLLVAAGCVNDYVRGELGEGGSTAAVDMPRTTGGASTSGASGMSEASAGGEGSTDASSSSSSTGGGSGDVPTSSAGGDGSGASSSSGEAPHFELCGGPCDADAQCGLEPDLCVQLTRGAEGRCLRRCGRGCPEGYTCLERTSVEGASAEQCVPDDNMCA
ncbi:MAG: hypothetical protein ACE37F_26265 [Nannocystaceae bacterium]|nr:hypothetical protein [bacterium]